MPAGASAFRRRAKDARHRISTDDAAKDTDPGSAPVILEQLSKALEKVRQSDSITVLLDEPRKPAPKHKIFRYLLRGLAIERPNQVWCAHITHVPISDAERAAILNEIKVEFKRKGRVLEVE